MSRGGNSVYHAARVVVAIGLNRLIRSWSRTFDQLGCQVDQSSTQSHLPTL